MKVEVIMSNKINPPKDRNPNKSSSHIAGTPSIAELRRRAMIRQQKAMKSASAKKHRRQEKNYVE